MKVLWEPEIQGDGFRLASHSVPLRKSKYTNAMVLSIAPLTIADWHLPCVIVPLLVPKEMRMNEILKLLDDNAVLPLWPETGNILGLCRNATYAAAARGEIRTIQFGRLKRVPSAWLKA